MQKIRGSLTKGLSFVILKHASTREKEIKKIENIRTKLNTIEQYRKFNLECVYIYIYVYMLR